MNSFWPKLPLDSQKLGLFSEHQTCTKYDHIDPVSNIVKKEFRNEKIRLKNPQKPVLGNPEANYEYDSVLAQTEGATVSI